jgi:hypothetical protein
VKIVWEELSSPTKWRPSKQRHSLYLPPQRKQELKNSFNTHYIRLLHPFWDSMRALGKKFLRYMSLHLQLRVSNLFSIFTGKMTKIATNLVRFEVFPYHIRTKHPGGSYKSPQNCNNELDAPYEYGTTRRATGFDLARLSPTIKCTVNVPCMHAQSQPDLGLSSPRLYNIRQYVEFMDNRLLTLLEDTFMILNFMTPQN